MCVILGFVMFKSGRIGGIGRSENRGGEMKYTL